MCKERSLSGRQIRKIPRLYSYFNKTDNAIEQITLGRFSIEVPSYQYIYYHGRDKMVSRPSNLIMKIPTRKDDLYIETGPVGRKNYG